MWLKCAAWFSVSQSASGPCAVSWMDEHRTHAQHCFLPGFFGCLFVWPFCTSFLFHSVALHCFIWKKKKKNTKEKISVVCSTFSRNRRCKCLYIVQHLYKYLPSALSGGNIEVYEIVPLFFYVKKTTMREKIFKNEWKKIRLWPWHGVLFMHWK